MICQCECFKKMFCQYCIFVPRPSGCRRDVNLWDVRRSSCAARQYCGPPGTLLENRQPVNFKFHMLNTSALNCSKQNHLLKLTIVTVYFHQPSAWAP